MRRILSLHLADVFDQEAQRVFDQFCIEMRTAHRARQHHFAQLAQQAGVEPFAWFKDVLSRIGSHPINRIAELLPHNWAPDQV